MTEPSSRSKRKRGPDDVARAQVTGASGDTDDSEAAEERAEHHYMLKVGDDFDKGRYSVVQQLGKGTFGRVVEMWDASENLAVAVKVVRAVEKYAREAEIESDIIRALQRTLPAEGAFPIVRLLRTFESHGHYCLAFEKMGPSLYSALKAARSQKEAATGGRGAAGSYLTLPQISHIAADCFTALAHMHRIQLTHTDLKPENVLFTRPPPSGGPFIPAMPDGALIDVGGATWNQDHHSSIVCTRQYRPPEVTLGLDWGMAVDMWSMGCILAELWTGSLLFSTHDEVEHLALIERTLGALPRFMLRAATCKRADRNFRHGYLRWPERAIDRESEEHVRSQRRLRECLSTDARGEPLLQWTSELAAFHDLLLRCLEHIPEQRLTASAALQHPFVRRSTQQRQSAAQGAAPAASSPHASTQRGSGGGGSGGSSGSSSGGNGGGDSARPADCNSALADNGSAPAAPVGGARIPKSPKVPSPPCAP